MSHRDIRLTLPRRDAASPLRPASERVAVVPPWLAPAAAALVIVVMTATLGGIIIERNRSGAMRRELRGVEARMGQHDVSTPAPPSAATYLDIITRQEQAAQWDAAYATAQTALTLPGLRREDRQALATHAATDGLNALFATPAAPADPAVQQHAIDHTATLRQLAATQGVPFPLSNRQLAERAYQVSLFLLAKSAFESALGTGEISAEDHLQLQFYDSVLFNQGWHYATAGPDASTREDGLRLLMAAYRLDLTYQLGSGLPWGALTQLLGPDEQTWTVEPAPTPLLTPDVPSGRPGRLE